MPQYYNYLKALQEAEVSQISSPAIAKRMNLNEVQVRKDLAAVSANGGKPRKGYNVNELLLDIEQFLGYNNTLEAVLVGAGFLGSALLSYHMFEECGVKIVAAFDNNKYCTGMQSHSKIIYPMQKLPDLCRRLNIKIGIITVPAHCAQNVCDLLVASGVMAIWNFADVHLTTPQGVIVHNENMAVSLALLSKSMHSKKELHKAIHTE